MYASTVSIHESLNYDLIATMPIESIKCVLSGLGGLIGFGLGVVNESIKSDIS